MNDHLSAIRAQLDRLYEDGNTIEFWWRDDDAVRHTPALDHLLALAAETGSPVAIATIPAGAERSLADRLRDEDLARLLVHGYAHANHAPPGGKTAEFGPHRPLPVMVDEARRGRETVREMFGGKALDIFVPPWNRLAPELLPGLARAGFRAVSAFVTARSAAGDIAFIDTHLDPVDWRGSRSLAEPEALAAGFARAIRATDAGRRGPIGLLTHHLHFDEALWRFVAELLTMLRAHPGIRWRALGELDWMSPTRVVDDLTTSRHARRLECPA